MGLGITKDDSIVNEMGVLFENNNRRIQKKLGNSLIFFVPFPSLPNTL